MSGCERQQQRARQQRRDHRERRVLGRRRDEHDPAVLDARQQRVLLRLREAVDLVEEEDRRLAVEVALGQRLLHDLAHVAHAGGDRRELDEPPARRAGDRLRERRLARAGRSPQDDRGRARSRHPESASVTSGEPGRSRCPWPATSSSDVGRIRTASGVCRLEEPGPRVRALTSRIQASPRARDAGDARFGRRSVRCVGSTRPGTRRGTRRIPWRPVARIAQRARRASARASIRRAGVPRRPGAPPPSRQPDRRHRRRRPDPRRRSARRPLYFTVGPGAPTSDARRPRRLRRRTPTDTTSAVAHATPAPSASPTPTPDALSGRRAVLGLGPSIPHRRREPR